MIENSITEGTRLIVRDINDEMESAFIDYSMSSARCPTCATA